MTRLLLFLAFALTTDSATCAVYKCVDEDGQVSYQQIACPTEQSQEQVHVADGPTLTGIGVTWLYGFQFEIKVIAKLPQG